METDNFVPSARIHYRIEHTSGVAVPEPTLVADMKRVARDFGAGRLSARLYQAYGKYSHTTARKRFGSWNEALRAAELPILNEFDVSRDKLFENLEMMWVRLGRQPRKREMATKPSQYSERPYSRQFGSWRKALEAFEEWAETDENRQQPGPCAENGSRRRTPREPNHALSFRVMKRDRFACRHCGRSPAKYAGLELHVDHVIPWSRGGETVLQNLQTLCSECNLGKGAQSERFDVQPHPG